MSKKSSKKDKEKEGEIKPSGPGDDCHCPVCIFVKTQVSGDPYDITQCPKCNLDSTITPDKNKGEGSV